MKNIIFLIPAILFNVIFINRVLSQDNKWQVLPNSPIPDSVSQRFEDVYFANPYTGWTIQYTGKVFKTTNAGENWSDVYTASNFPQGFFRSLGFFNEDFGLMGTLFYSSPMFRTTNGGLNWIKIENIPPPVPIGICGISIVNDSVAYGTGRYSGPATVIKTTDKGATWTTLNVSTGLARSLVDCYFWSEDSGIVVGGWNTSNYLNGVSVILKTTDGGLNWTRVYMSTRTGEWCWKISFYSSDTGFVSIERHSGMSYYLKTTDKGQTWQEKPFIEYDQEGIGFINQYTGWIGGWTGPTYETTNGGISWNQVTWGFYLNRFRFINDTLAYSVGNRVYKYSRDTTRYDNALFAIIGDYGKAGINELNVSNLVKYWNPDFILTTGGNNFDLGEESTIDDNIGQYYHPFIYPYTGGYGSGDTVNRFFPTMDEVDWNQTGAVPYLNYFQLPGNERYYDFVKGNVHFFALSSDSSESDGNDSNSVQAQWLKDKLENSTEQWNIVFFHHAPYSSGIDYSSSEEMRWPFGRWGASAVISGHHNVYERLYFDDIPYFVNGLGGKVIGEFGSPVAGSQVRYNGNFGAMINFAYDDSLVFRFYNKDRTKIDHHKIYPAAKKLVTTLFIEGLYDELTKYMKPDLVGAYIRKAVSPYEIVDSTKTFIQNNGVGRFNFFNPKNATDYYVVISHRNSIDTWSSLPQKFIANNMNYDFTADSSQAYGNNLILKGNVYCIYSGDVNKDDVIDGLDLGLIDNDASVFLTGFLVTDLNFDFIIDGSDYLIADNNAANFIGVIQP
ncbi:MAG: Ycf48-like protein [Ignavibacteria bacterium]|nr:Ycf48-like protein [Ignavibacteria bacterium]